MNTLLSRRVGRYFGQPAILAASLLTLWACKQDPQSANGPQTVLPLSSGGGTAHPAIAYRSSVTTGSGHTQHTYPAIGVMDSDGTHQTNVYVGTSSAGEIDPTWSPNGGSISWVLGKNIVAIDVSVNSSGVPVGSNFRTIAATPSSDAVAGFFIISQAWCSVTTTGKIAFIYENWNTGITKLCTVSISGGAWDTLAVSGYNIYYNELYTVTWSPDDAKLAVVREDDAGPINSKLMIYTRSSSAFTDSISAPSGKMFGNYAHFIPGPQWSRTGGVGGTAYLCAQVGSTSSPYNFALYYVQPTNGSTPSTNGVSSRNSTWSPNNSSVMVSNGASLSGVNKVVSLTSTTTNILTTPPGDYINWKR
jgi:hypothetical protein